MANLNFKYGSSYAALKAKPYAEGTIYVTTEEKAMYVDLNNERIRLGQTIVFPTWAAFDESVTLPPQSPEAFYYIEGENALLKYTGYTVDANGDVSGGTWKQINSTSVLEGEVKALKEKVNGIDATVTSHGGKITTIEGQITALQNKDTELAGAIDTEKARAEAAEKANADAIKAEETRAKGAESTLTTNLNAVTGRVTTLEGKVGAPAEGDNAATGLYLLINNETARAIEEEGKLNKAISDEKDRALNAESALGGRIDTVNTNITTIQGNINTINNNITNLQTKDGELEQAIADEAARAAGEEGRIEGLVTAEASRADTEEKRLAGLIDSLTNSAATKTALAEEVARARAAEEKNASDIVAANQAHADLAGRVTTLEGEMDTAQDDISTAKGKITAIEGQLALKANAADVAGEIARLDLEIGDPANGGTAATGLYALIDNLSGGASGLAARVEQAEKDIDALEQADKNINTAIDGIKANYVKVSDYNTKIGTIEGNISTNASDIDALETRAGNIESAATALEGRVTAVENKNTAQDTLIAGHTNKITGLETDLADLTAYVGTIPADSAATNVVDYINNKMATADAMQYKGGVDNVSKLPTSGVEAGDTYIITANHVSNGVSYYAGDLIVANKDGAAAIGDWDHVATGYQASQENKLVKKDNGIVLQSYAGTSLGSFNVTSDNLTVTVTSQVDANTGALAAENTTVKMNLEWGTF